MTSYTIKIKNEYKKFKWNSYYDVIPLGSKDNDKLQEYMFFENIYIILIKNLFDKFKEKNIKIMIFKQNEEMKNIKLIDEMKAICQKVQNNSNFSITELPALAIIFLRSYWTGIIYGENFKIHFGKNYELYIDVTGNILISDLIPKELEYQEYFVGNSNSVKNYLKKLKNKTINLSYTTGECIYTNEQNKSKTYNTIFSIYNIQYPPIFNDNFYMYIVNYEKGLFAYNYATGELIWKINIKKIHENFILKNYIIFRVENDNVYIGDATDGKNIKKLNSDGIYLFKISESEIIYSKNNMLIIYDVYLKKEKGNVKIEELNKKQYFNFVITSCIKKNKYLIFKGFNDNNMGTGKLKTHWFTKKIKIVEK